MIRRPDQSLPPPPPRPYATGDQNSVRVFQQTLLLSADGAGRLVCVDGHRCLAAAAGCGCWMLSVPLADDCHSYNCRLELSAAGGAVGLRTTAAVLPGQPLKMWFPPDLQLMLHVPFLTPANIRGEWSGRQPGERDWTRCAHSASQGVVCRVPWTFRNEIKCTSREDGPIQCYRGNRRKRPKDNFLTHRTNS